MNLADLLRREGVPVLVEAGPLITVHQDVDVSQNPRFGCCVVVYDSQYGMLMGPYRTKLSLILADVNRELRRLSR